MSTVSKEARLVLLQLEMAIRLPANPKILAWDQVKDHEQTGIFGINWECQVRHNFPML